MIPVIPKLLHEIVNECYSPNFTLPPKQTAPTIIKFGLFSWKLGRFFDGFPREILLSCSMCDYRRVTALTNDLSSFVFHLKSEHRQELIDLTQAGFKAVNEGADRKETILDTDLACYAKDKHDYSSGNPLAPNQIFPEFRNPSGFDEKVARSKILDFMLDSELPFSAVACESASRIFSYFKNENYTVSPSAFSEDIDELHSGIVQASKAKLAQVKGRFALSLEVSKSTDNHEFFGITLHYHDDDFEFMSYTIGFEHFNQTLNHTGESLYERFMKVVTDYGIHERISSITCADIGPFTFLVNTFKRNCEEKGLLFHGRIQCARNALDMSAEEFHDFTFFKRTEFTNSQVALKEIKAKSPDFREHFLALKDLPVKLELITNIFRDKGFLRSALRRTIRDYKLKRNSISAGAPEVLLAADNENWSSTHKMLERMIEFREEITEVLKQPDILELLLQEDIAIDMTELRDSDWAYMTILCDIFDMFQRTINVLKMTDKETSNLTIFHIRRLLRQLNQNTRKNLHAKNSFLHKGLIQAERKLFQYYPVQDPEDCSLQPLHFACILDPRHKLLGYELFKEVSPTTIPRIQRNFTISFRSFKEVFEKEKSLAKGPGIEECVGGDNNKDDFSVTTESRGNLEAELTRYLSEPRSNRRVTIQDFYNARERVFPVISRMAREYLSIPAMAASLRELSSRVGEEVSRKRKRTMIKPSIQELAIIKAQIGECIDFGLDSGTNSGGANNQSEDDSMCE
ncbi:hAT family C-terminal dimerization region [Metschnikowia aff. pulcherrima]|uniref:HAT family C-terminal dimerization region n=1 Tax=Metschnikowia aff. pulcherrima TaxID=2163413 RepID=A0A4V1ADJ5_9ASCO|nr:hAT family C-terminal dimerization region [Metschnikowia aff. pulcherrima]